MAPNFLSKLVKPQADRRSADHSRNSSPARPHSKSLGAADSDSSFHSPALVDGSNDGHPNVTVVPPSPAGHDRSQTFSFPSDDHAHAHQRFSTDSQLGLSRRADGGVERRAVSLVVGTTPPLVDDAMPTPTPDSKALPRSLTDSALGLDLADLGHARRGSNASTFSSGDEVPIMQTIVESPTALRPEFIPHGSINIPALALSPSASSNTTTSSFLSPHRRADTDAASITSTSSKKRRPWKRGSNPGSPSANIPSLPSTISVTSSGSISKRKDKDRKQTGLAGALAATGLAMANTGTPIPQMLAQNVVMTPPQQKANGSGLTLMKSSSSTSLAKSRSQSDLRSTISGSPTRRRIPSGSSQGHKNGRVMPKSRSRNASIGSGEVAGGGDSDDLFDSASDEDGLSDEESSDELDEDDIPVTGFAVASNKRNADFHELFPTIPEGDYLIDDYGCALQREILIQGRLYISENHVCFHANIFGWITDLCIPMYDITSLEKKMTAFVIPNAIQINTRKAKYAFASFLSRDTTFDVIYNIWRLARPEDSSMGRSSLDTDDVGGVNGEAGEGAAKTGRRRKVTQCACLKSGEHFSETAIDTILPGTPEKIYNLMFASGFMKEFMVEDQLLQDIQVSDWAPIPDDPSRLARNMSYIKPLSGGLGPKQTKCELRDETVHCDFEDYIVTVTTTRTPDVPSGNVFSVKTKTCLMWASSVSTRVIVTSQVEWTGRSFIKGIIEKSCIEGQKTYHAELDAAVRRYISAHQSEFVPEGVDPDAAIAEGELAEAEAAAAAASPSSSSPAAAPKDQRGLQWAWDTFEGAYKVGKQSAGTAIELLRDAWEQSTTTTVLYFVIVFLVVSNIYSLAVVGKREEVGRRKEMRRTEEREKWVQGVVTGLWEELAAGRSAAAAAAAIGAGGGVPVIRASGDWRAEVGEITRALDALEVRVLNLRESLKDLD